MKISSATGLLGLASVTNAFPTDMFEKLKDNPELGARAANILEGRAKLKSADAAAKIFEPVPIFNAKAQYIDVSAGSGHEWAAPGANDQRGPCPGLNAMANHGFLPRNGYATTLQFIDAVMTVTGMGPVLAGFLAAYGSAIDGSGLAWSIGGTPIAGDQDGNGISNSHNKYESDASPLRPDLYQYGNDYKVRIQQYQQLADLSPAPSNYDISTLTLFRWLRFNAQKAQNPYFFNGPFTGILVQPAAYTFIYRFMANHSAENTEGVLNRQVFQSWFSITGTNKNYKWVPGHERIPDNWYRRALEYPYEQPYFIADVANAAAIFPEFLDVGGNTGEPGTFTGVDVSDLSGGIYNSGNIGKGNNFACLAYQFAANVEPDVLLNSGLAKMRNVIGKLQGKLSCPTLSEIDASQLQQFPGYTKSGSPYG